MSLWNKKAGVISLSFFLSFTTSHLFAHSLIL
jgi:hypothetical protein